jgi:CRISPR/Cas system-associated exonuclease Cas4 (RecB family)
MAQELLAYRRKYISPIGRYSPTQVSSFMKCPRQYYYTYREGLIIPPSGGMLLGKSCHFGFQKNYEQKKESKEDLPLDTIMDIYGQSFEDNVKAWEIIDWKESLQSGRTWETIDRKPADVKDEGYRIIKLYREKIAPAIQPLAIEQRIELDLKTGVVFNGTTDTIKYVGYIDLVKQGDQIIDHKIRKKFPSADEVRDSLQLTSYAVAWSLISKKPIDQIPVALDYFLRTKTEAQYKGHITIRDQRQVGELKDMINTLHYAHKQIESGAPWDFVFHRRMGGWECSPKWCGFFHICRCDLPKPKVVREIEKETEKVSKTNLF